jgi:photosystem II stability/assembly factor-like uncharacterized protein
MRIPTATLLLGLALAGCAEQAPPWTVHELGTRAGFRDVFFVDQRRGWIVGGGHDIEGGIIGSTSDGGLTWSFRSAVVRPSRRASSFHLNAVWFLDARTGFVAGDGFHLARTVDGGEHWHEVVPSHRVSAHLQDLQFVDDEYGWAVGSGGLLRPTDGGDTWDGPLIVDETARPVRYWRGRALHFHDRNRGWIVGSAGLIRATADGGATWTEIGGPRSSSKPDLWGLDFVDENLGWVVGEHGTILHTADGGATWQLQASGVADTLMDVDFIDVQAGWAVGFERHDGTSVILHTTDGGASWTEQQRVSTEAARALFVLDADHAWVVGEQQRRGPNDGSQKLLRFATDEPAG